MATRCKYLITDTRTGVFQEGSADYLAGLLYVTPDDIRRAERKGALLKTRWRVELTDVYKDFAPELKAEWDSVTAMFKNIEWVSENGRKLKLKRG